MPVVLSGFLLGYGETEKSTMQFESWIWLKPAPAKEENGVLTIEKPARTAGQQCTSPATEDQR